jgi:hypothetical protein
MGVVAVVTTPGTTLQKQGCLELTPGEPSLETPERFWIPELAWRFRFFWQQQNWCGRSLYQKARKQGWLQHQ